jgi:hypothetical protein
MNKNKKSKEMSNILIVALILVALLSIWNTVDIYNFKDIFKKGFQLNGMHCGCEMTWKYEKACTRDILVRDK